MLSLVEYLTATVVKYHYGTFMYCLRFITGVSSYSTDRLYLLPFTLLYYLSVHVGYIFLVQVVHCVPVLLFFLGCYRIFRGIP